MSSYNPCPKCGSDSYDIVKTCNSDDLYVMEVKCIKCEFACIAKDWNDVVIPNDLQKQVLEALPEIEDGYDYLVGQTAKYGDYWWSFSEKRWVMARLNMTGTIIRRPKTPELEIGDRVNFKDKQSLRLCRGQIKYICNNQACVYTSKNLVEELQILNISELEKVEDPKWGTE